MEIKKRTLVKVNEGVIYYSGYTLRLTAQEFETLLSYLKDRKAVASQVIDTQIRDHLKTDLVEGFNFVGVTTFKVVEDYYIKEINKPFKSNGNRYLRIIIKK